MSKCMQYHGHRYIRVLVFPQRHVTTYEERESVVLKFGHIVQVVVCSLAYICF
jgi:hypothetical protein